MPSKQKSWEDGMKLYSSMGPNPAVVAMFLAEKGVEIPVEKVDLMGGENRQAPYVAKNPAGQLPCLELDDGSHLAEITAICEYLDEKYPSPPLIGTTPEERAETRMWTRRIDLGIMYLGYLAIAGQLLIVASEITGYSSWIGNFSIHLFSFGVMGLIAPAMIIRISRGHTGRKVKFDVIDKAVLWIMILALVLRVVTPQLDPVSYRLWIELAATCWFIGFGILAWRSTPMLLRPRIDGRDH